MVNKSIDRNKEFFFNTSILFLGKFSTQFISLLLIPLFTRTLLSDDYGFVDLIQTYITLFVPIIILRIDSASFRFLINKRDNEKETNKIISNIFILMILSIFISLILFKLLNNFIEIKYFNYVIFNFLALMVSNIVLQLLRGIGKNIDYSISSIIIGTTNLIINIILIKIYNFNASSILISSTISNVFGSVYGIIKLKLFKRLKFRYYNKIICLDILKYSIPMIPNSLSWWIVNVSDRSIISIFLGVSMNGIYTISCKFSNILNSIYSIINMSWQETATLHINDDDKDEYFSQMINKIFFIFCSFSLAIISLLPFCYIFVIGESYMESYKYIPILLYANSWNVLTGLIGGIYVAKKLTKEIANTTIISAVINIIINFILIKFIGLYAACLSTLVSYVIIGLYRYLDCQKYVRIKLDFIKFILYTAIYIVCSLIYCSNNIKYSFIGLIICIISCIYFNKSIFTYLSYKIKYIFSRK